MTALDPPVAADGVVDEERGGPPREQDPLLHLEPVHVAGNVAAPSIEPEQAFSVSSFRKDWCSDSVLDAARAVEGLVPSLWGNAERNFSGMSLQPASSPSPDQWRILSVKASCAAGIFSIYLAVTVYWLLQSLVSVDRQWDHVGLLSIFPATLAWWLIRLRMSRVARDYDKVQSLYRLSMLLVVLGILRGLLLYL